MAVNGNEENLGGARRVQSRFADLGGACNEMERAGLLDHLHSLNDTLDGLGYSLRWQVEREAEFQHVHILVVVAGSTP